MERVWPRGTSFVFGGQNLTEAKSCCMNILQVVRGLPRERRKTDFDTTDEAEFVSNVQGVTDSFEYTGDFEFRFLHRFQHELAMTRDCSIGLVTIMLSSPAALFRNTQYDSDEFWASLTLWGGDYAELTIRNEKPKLYEFIAEVWAASRASYMRGGAGMDLYLGRCGAGRLMGRFDAPLREFFSTTMILGPDDVAGDRDDILGRLHIFHRQRLCRRAVLVDFYSDTTAPDRPATDFSEPLGLLSPWRI